VLGTVTGVAVDVLRYAAFPDLDDPAGLTAGGNLAGVVLDATGMTPAAMQATAADVGFSETAFLVPTGSATARARYFAPRREVAFCGHATLAAAVAHAERGGAAVLTLDTAAGPVVVDTDPGEAPVTAVLTSPPAATLPLPPAIATRLLAALALDSAELDPSWPLQVASAGNLHPVVVVRTRHRLATLDYRYGPLLTLTTEQGWTTVSVLWPEPGTRTLWARNPFPVGGVREDPATGAAAAAVGAYLRDSGRARPGERWVVRQGHDMGRPSRLDVEVGDDRMRVSGRAVRV
jgi:PhzF family phenazine biosynthesis protein